MTRTIHHHRTHHHHHRRRRTHHHRHHHRRRRRTHHHRHHHRRRRRRHHRLWPTMLCTGVRAPLPYPNTARLSPPACRREKFFPTDFDWWAAQQIIQLRLSREMTKVFLYGDGTCNEPGMFCHLLLPSPPPTPFILPHPVYITP